MKVLQCIESILRSRLNLGSGETGIWDQIFESFLEKLRKENQIPSPIVEKLEELEEKKDLWTEKALLEVITKEGQNDSQDKID